MLAGVITRSFEVLGLRGAPTILGYLFKFSNAVATAILKSGERISFPSYDPYWCRHLYAGVPFEPDVEAIFRRFANGRTLVDCGANIGYWSARSKGLGFNDAIAIEANGELIPILKRNFDGAVHHAAVHSASGKTLYLVGSGAAGHLGAHGRPVPTLALNDLAIEGPCVVKLDVEGAEIPALEGADKLDAIFVYEDWPRSGMEVTRYLLEKGWRIEGCDETPILSLEDAYAFNKRTRETYGPSNFVAHSRPIVRVEKTAL